ncbi:unnamed protein product [Ceratitis capitata]|uniref:(Mediterranean fruit fly) hypothetical protein n=1 Tax=Ceratitis capitata TaxID=7213 RepID=A0A811VH05_CERCA|nr:unnamed protein product [Ceratitis capitata]
MDEQQQDGMNLHIATSNASNNGHNNSNNNNNNGGDESDEEIIEGMELLEGNYQVLRQWVPPAPNYWDAPPKAIIKSAEVR